MQPTRGPLLFGGGSMSREKGFVLPVVMLLIVLMSSLFLFATVEWSKWKKQDRLRLKMVQAEYAAESGIAERQAQLQRSPDDYRTVQKKYGEYTVDISVWESVEKHVFIQAVARGNGNIQQTKTAEVEKSTLRILYWLD